MTNHAQNPYTGHKAVRALAREVGVSCGYMVLVYQGLRTPSPAVAMRISDATGHTMDVLYRYWAGLRVARKTAKKASKKRLLLAKKTAPAAI